MLIPSIDLSGGRAVQLRHGRELILESARDPRELAEGFGRVGEIAVIDLDAARGIGDQRALIEELCRIAPCRVGGGVRDLDRARRLLRAGARKLIVGTRVEPAFLRRLPADRVMAAVDARHDTVVDHGWTAVAGEDPIARTRRLAPYVSGFLYTVVDREGTERGVDLERVRALAEVARMPVTAAGGIGSLREVAALDRLGIDAQVGMALYRGRFTAADGLAAVIRFGKDGGSVPTVVQDHRDGRVLMVARSTRETLVEAVDRGETVLWSRRRGRWRKGETSGATQRLIRVEPDCDRDALLFLVEPHGPSCHRGTESCFGDRPFSLAALEDVIRRRAVAADAAGYTRRLLDDRRLRAEKIVEEAGEVVRAATRDEVRWEVADLVYHTLVHLRAAGLTLRDVAAELEARRG